MFLLNLLATSIVLLICLIAGVGFIILSAAIIITLLVKISDWSDAHGSWVEWMALLTLLWLFALAITICLEV